MRQVHDGDWELPVGPHGHARDGGAVVRRRELRHACRGQRRVLIECRFVLVPPCCCCCCCCCEDFAFALSLGFCLGEDPTTNRKVRTRTDPTGASNSLGYLHRTPLPPPELHHWDSLPCPKRVLVEPLDKLVTLPDESYRWRDTCRSIQWVVGALLVFPSTGFGSWVRLPVRFELGACSSILFSPLFRFSMRDIYQSLLVFLFIFVLRNMFVVPQRCANRRGLCVEPESRAPSLVELWRWLRLGRRAH